jgi:DNA-binding NarL/FixJ family response regulator
MVEPTPSTPDLPSPVDRLSAREREVLGLAASGLTNTQIALRLRLTVHGVKFHLATTYRKLGVANRTEAAFVYLNLTRPAAAPLPDTTPG